MRNLVAMMLVAIWPVVTSHTLLESLGVKDDPDRADANHHHHHHGNPDPHHHDQKHEKSDSEEHREHNADNHTFADGDYAWTPAAKTLKAGLSIWNLVAFFCASSLSSIEAKLDSPGPAPPGAAPPLIQKTWQFSVRAAVPARAPSIIS